MTTSTLINTTDGRAALTVAARFLLERRLSRFFKRNLVIDYHQWKQNGQFTLETLVGSLNGLNDQEILDLYHLLGTMGGLPVSLADTTIYVNGVTGSDATGDGTITKPFATLSFMDTIPTQLNHKYRVVLTGDVNDPTRNLLFNFEFGPNGSFAILGAGAPTVLQAGCQISPAGLNPLGNEGGSIIICVPGFGPDAVTSFLRSGDYAVPCHKTYVGGDAVFNTPPWSSAGILAGDLVDVVRPARTLTINSIGSFCKGYTGFTQSQLVICNLNIAFTLPIPGPPPPWPLPALPKFKWHNDCFSTLSFVRFQDSWQGNQGYSSIQNGNSIEGGYLNTHVMVDTVEIETLAACGINNLDNPDPQYDPFFADICGAQFDGNQGGLDIKNATITALDLKVACNVAGEGLIENCCFLKLVLKKANYEVKYCILDGQQGPGGTYGGLEVSNSNVNVARLTVLESDNVFVVSGGAFMTITLCGSDVTHSQIIRAGLRCTGQNWIDAWYSGPGTTPLNSGMVGLVGQIEDITATAGPVLTAWPATDVPAVCGHTTVIVEK